MIGKFLSYISIVSLDFVLGSALLCLLLRFSSGSLLAFSRFWNLEIILFFDSLLVLYWHLQKTLISWNNLKYMHHWLCWCTCLSKIIFSAQSLNWLNQSLGRSRRTERPCPRDSRVKWTSPSSGLTEPYIDPSMPTTTLPSPQKCFIIRYIMLYHISYILADDRVATHPRRPEQKQERLLHWGSPWNRNCHHFTFCFLKLQLLSENYEMQKT